MGNLCAMCNSNPPVDSIELCLKCAGYNATFTLKDFEHIMRQDHPELPVFHIEFLASVAYSDSQRIYQVARTTIENAQLREREGKLLAFVERVTSHAPLWLSDEAAALLGSLEQPESEGE